MPGEGDQGGRKVKRGELILYAGAGERKTRGEAAMADGRGRLFQTSWVEEDVEGKIDRPPQKKESSWVTET